MLHNWAKPHFLVVTQRPDMHHIVGIDGKRPLFVVNAIDIPTTRVKQGRFPGHAAFQPGNFTSTGTLHPGVTIPPSQNMTLF